MAKHIKNVLSAATASLIMFILFGVLSLFINGIFSFQSITSFILVMIISNIISVLMMVIISHAISILKFKKGLDSDRFVTPLESSFAYLTTTIALLLALLLLA